MRCISTSKFGIKLQAKINNGARFVLLDKKVHCHCKHRSKTVIIIHKVQTGLYSDSEPIYQTHWPRVIDDDSLVWEQLYY